MKLRILLTGYRGYIGSHLDWGLSLKYGSDAVKRFYARRDDLEDWTKELIEFKKNYGPFDAVIHCGAISDMACPSNEAYVWNYRATQMLAYNFSDVPFYFYSSAAALEPVVNYYGWSKATAAAWLLDSHTQVCVLVPFYVFGGNEEGRGNNHYSVPYKIVTHSLPFVYEPWERDYIHVKDVVELTLQAVENGAIGLYHLGTGIGNKVTDLCRIAGGAVPIIYSTDSKYPEFGEVPRVANERIQYGDKGLYIDVRDWIKEKGSIYEDSCNGS